MKTIATVILSVLATVVLFPRSSGHAATYRPPAGRYAIVHTYQDRALMVDTVTGAVWEFVHSEYCQSKTKPGMVRQIDYSDSCAADEDAIPIREFQRISVGGLYTVPLEKYLEKSTLKSLNWQDFQKPKR